MTAVLKSPASPVRAPLPTPQNRQRLQTLRQEKYQAAVARLAVPPTPLWVRLLVALQRSSTPIAVLLVVGVLPIYAWSASTQRFWGEASNRLQELRRHERELVAANEIRKYQITQQAEQFPVGLVRQVPGNTLFLKPQPARPLKPIPSDRPTVQPLNLSSPIGY